MSIEQSIGGRAAATAEPDQSPEVQLERFLLAGKPTLALFHSDNSGKCIKMMEVIL